MEILKELIGQCLGSGGLVCADSYFASVQVAKVTIQEGLKFIGVVKIATTKYPMKILKSIEMQKRWDRVGLIEMKMEVNCDLLTFTCMDRKIRYVMCSDRI